MHKNLIIGNKWKNKQPCIILSYFFHLSLIIGRGNSRGLLVLLAFHFVSMFRLKYYSNGINISKRYKYFKASEIFANNIFDEYVYIYIYCIYKTRDKTKVNVRITYLCIYTSRFRSCRTRMYYTMLDARVETSEPVNFTTVNCFARRANSRFIVFLRRRLNRSRPCRSDDRVNAPHSLKMKHQKLTLQSFPSSIKYLLSLC